LKRGIEKLRDGALNYTEGIYPNAEAGFFYSLNA